MGSDRFHFFHTDLKENSPLALDICFFVDPITSKTYVEPAVVSLANP